MDRRGDRACGQYADALLHSLKRVQLPSVFEVVPRAASFVLETPGEHVPLANHVLTVASLGCEMGVWEAKKVEGWVLESDAR